MQCPKCKRHYDDPDMRYCPFCEDLTPLVSATASPPPPRAARHSLDGEQSAPPPVVVEVREEKKRRLNPAWLLLLLLMLITCCCGLLLTEQVEVPEFAAPYVAPFLEDMRESFRGIIGDPKPDEGGGQPKDKDIDCDDFAENVVELAVGKTNCDQEKQLCYFQPRDVTGLDLEDYGDLELIYEWEDGQQKKADCKGPPTEFHCQFPYKPNSDLVRFSFKIDDCKVRYSKRDGLLEEAGGDDDAIKFNLSEQLPDCCPDLEVTYTGYIEPTVLRLLEINLSCEDGAWNIDDGECIGGETLVGADQNIFWTDVDCCLSDDELHCESPGTVDQKKSWTKLELSGDTCSSEVFFQSTYYEQGGTGDDESPCKSGEILCGGSCCDPSDCYDGECSP